VKIGYAKSSSDARARLDSLQVAHWENLRLLRLWEGETRDEQQMHLRFADLRIRGEWFSFSRLMLGDVGLTVIELGQNHDTLISADEVFRLLGGAGDVARLCGTSRGVISRWMWANHVPESKRAVLLERARERGITGVTVTTFDHMPPSGRLPRTYRPYKDRTPIIIVKSQHERNAHWVALRAQKRTLADIAKAYGVSRERVRQVVSRPHAIPASAGVAA
jgi:hypothetical protein